MYRDATSLVGKEIDGYRIEGILGRGGMGIVYQAEDLTLGRKVALKVIAPELSEDETFLKRFRREARALAQLYHPHIVLIFALRQADLGLYIAMEYVEGQTLADHLETHSPIAWPQALPLIKELLSALDYAHERGIIHRDLKPRNIMLTQQGEVKVMDFGLAKMLGQGSGETTVTGARAGTLCYMSPEQVRGLKNVDHRSDLFSLGLTLYEVLAGCLPFKKDDSDFTILKAIVEERFPDPLTFNETLPRPLAEIIMKALEKDPEHRYQSAGEMLAAIESFEQQERAPDKATVVVSSPSSVIPKKRTRSLRLAAVALLVLALAGYLFLPALTGLLSSTEPTSESPVTADEQGDLATQEQPEEPLALVPSTPAPQDQPEEAADTEALASTGTLTVRSDPPGARILLDHTPRGTTPQTLDEVPAGQHTIGLRLDSYEAYTASVVVEAQQTESVEVTLVPLMGILQVSVRPWGRLYVDGELIKGEVTAPSSIDLSARRHTVTIEHPDFGKWQRSVVISPETPKVVVVDFTRLVEVTVIAFDTEGHSVRGEITVDGTSMGSAPRTIQVRVGLRRIEVHADGYVIDGAAPVINFEQDLTETLKITLRKEAP